MDNEAWRSLINDLDAPDLDETNLEKPSSEMIDDSPKSVENQRFFVQKILTEIYVYTDLENQQYGEISFQNVISLGTMPGDKMLKLFRRKRKQLEQDS